MREAPAEVGPMSHFAPARGCGLTYKPQFTVQTWEAFPRCRELGRTRGQFINTKQIFYKKLLHFFKNVIYYYYQNKIY